MQRLMLDDLARFGYIGMVDPKRKMLSALVGMSHFVFHFTPHFNLTSFSIIMKDNQQK